MITLTQKYNNVFCSLLLNLQVWFKEYQELITAKHITDTPIHLVIPFWFLASTSYCTRKRYFFSEPVDYIKVCIRYLYSGVFCTRSRYMAVCVKETGNIANLIKRKARKINFDHLKLVKCVCTFLRAVYTFAFFYFTRLWVKCITAAQTLFGRFGFSINNFSKFSISATRTLIRAKSLLPSGEWFLAFFAFFHRIRVYKLITECKGKNYEN